MWKKDMTPFEAAQLIERFLQNKSLYPQEWNDFVDTPQENTDVETSRKRCYELDPLVNRPGTPDPTAEGELVSLSQKLRITESPERID